MSHMSIDLGHDKIQQGDIEFVRTFLDNGGDVNTMEFGDTMLTFAASMGQTEIVKLLIARGAKIAWQSGRTGWTPLMNATIANFTDIVRLVSKDALDIVNDDGQTALMIAAYQGFHDLIPELVTPTNIGLVDWRGNTALDYAAEFPADGGYKFLVNYMLEYMRNNAK